MMLALAAGAGPGLWIYSLSLLAPLLVILALSGRERLFAAVMLLLAVGLGGARESAQLLTLERGRRLLEFAGRGKQHIVFRADDIPERYEDYTVFQGTVERVMAGGTWIDLDARARLAAGDTVSGIFRGDRFAALARIDRPRTLRNPGGFDYGAYLSRRGVAAAAWVSSSRELVPIAADGPPNAAGMVDRLREKYLAWLRPVPGRGGELLRALLAGDREAMDQEALDAFSATGLAHLLAISGLHLCLVSACFFFVALLAVRWTPWLTERVPAQKTAALLTAPAVTAYALLSGMSVPTQRALIMVLTYLTALALDRRREVWNALGLAAAIILFVWPQALFEASFQLSFASVAGILYVSRRLAVILRPFKSAAEQELDMLEARLKKRKSGFRAKARAYLAATLFITLVAQWSILPLQLYFFHCFNLLSPLYNLAAIPVCGLVLIPGGLLASLLALVSAPLAGLVMRVLAAAAGALVQGAVLAADRAPGLMLLPALSWPGAVAWYGGGALLLEVLVARKTGSWSWRYFSPDQVRSRFLDHTAGSAGRVRGRAYPALVLSAVLLAAAGADLFRPRDSFPAGSMALAAIDVGQGQSLVMRTPAGKYLLVDGGGFYKSPWDIGKNVVAPCLLTLGVKKLDAVVLTHPHPDHGKGLLFILKRYRVGEFWRGPGENELTRALDAAARSRGIPVKVLDEGAGEFEFGGARVRVLHPPAHARVNLDDLNNLSLVLRIAGHGRTMLLTGDAERETEELLVEKYGPEGSVLPGALRADVMSVPHHGSKTSSAAEFLDAVAPGWALVSAGGHGRSWLPAPEVMERYAARGIRVQATDQDGFCAVVMKGDTVEPLRERL